MVNIIRPVRVPKNLRWLVIFASLTILLQIFVAAWPVHNKPSSINQPMTINTQSELIKKVSSPQNSPLKPGQLVQINLEVTNNSSQPQTYLPQVAISDIQQYANITNAKDVKIENGLASWPIIALDAGQSAANVLHLQIRSVLSDQAASTQDPESYDAAIQIHYGNTLTLPLRKSFAKTVEANIQQLPKLPKHAALIINVAILTALIVLILAARQREIILSKLTVNLLLAWYIGGFCVLLMCWLVSLYNGLQLSGSEALAGGAAGVLIALPVVLMEQQAN